MTLISNNRPKKLARPITKTPLDDPDAVGFGTTLAKVLRSYLTPTARSRPGRGGRQAVRHQAENPGFGKVRIVRLRTEPLPVVPPCRRPSALALTFLFSGPPPAVTLALEALAL